MSKKYKITHIVLADCILPEEFMTSLTEGSKNNWTILVRHGEMNVPKWKRLLNYVFFPLTVALRYRKAKEVIAWQQYYGILYIIYSWITFKRDVNIKIMTFIFNKKKGLLGSMHQRIVNYALTRPTVKSVFVYSTHEIDFYSSIFQQASGKFKKARLSIAQTYDSTPCDEEPGFLFAAGGSNRDFRFLIDTIAPTNRRLIIACSGLNLDTPPNIKILHGVHGIDMRGYLEKASIVIIPLKNLDISSGQLALLEAMRMSKPTIVSRNMTIMDYLVADETSIVIDNDPKQLLGALDRLEDPDTYNRMSKAAFKHFCTNFSLSSLGKTIAAK